MFFNITNRDGEKTISVFLENGETRVVPGSSPTFRPLFEYFMSTDESDYDEQRVENLVDPSRFIGAQMAEIAGDRVTFDMRDVFFDGRRLTEDNLLGRHLKAMIQNQDQNWRGLVRFLLNVGENPSRNAQQAIYEWVSKHGLTITEDGCFVGYKAVRADHMSESSGPNNYINGLLLGDPDVSYHVPHNVGDVISKKRADVDDTPGGGCSVGLHVGTYSYATGFAPVLMTVKVNPRDVVSAPGGYDSTFKIRVCRYEVMAMNKEKRDFIGKATTYRAGMEYMARNNPVLSTASRVEGVKLDVPLSPVEKSELEEAVQSLSSEPESDEDPMDSLGNSWTEEEMDQEFQDDPWANLFEAEQANDRKVLDVLTDTSVGHKPAARALEGLVHTTESSVRRWRKAHGIVLA